MTLYSFEKLSQIL